MVTMISMKIVKKDDAVEKNVVSEKIKKENQLMPILIDAKEDQNGRLLKHQEVKGIQRVLVGR